MTEEGATTDLEGAGGSDSELEDWSEKDEEEEGEEEVHSYYFEILGQISVKYKENNKKYIVSFSYIFKSSNSFFCWFGIIEKLV